MKFDLRKASGISTIAGVLLLVLATMAFSQGPGGPPPGRGGPWGGGPRDGFIPFARDLNLTDDQKAQIKKLTDASRESTKALLTHLRTASLMKMLFVPRHRHGPAFKLNWK